MVFYNALYLIVLFFSVDVLPRRCKERSELRGLVGCIYLFFNKYNWLCVFRWANVRQRKPGAEAGLYYAASLLFWNAAALIGDFNHHIIAFIAEE